MQYIVLFCAISPYIKTLNTVVWNIVPYVSAMFRQNRPISVNFSTVSKHWEFGQLWGLALLSLCVYFVLTFTVHRSSTRKSVENQKFVCRFLPAVFYTRLIIYSREITIRQPKSLEIKDEKLLFVYVSRQATSNSGLYRYIQCHNWQRILCDSTLYYSL